MFSTLRTRFGIPGVISVMALVFAMFGGAYAASNGSSGKATASKTKFVKGPRGPKGATGPAGPAGPAGPTGAAGPKGDTGAAGTNGTNGADGKDGTNGTNGKDGTSVTTTSFTGSKGTCTEGQGGVEVKSASPATYVCNGKEGSSGGGGGGLPATLPSGATETGSFFIRGESEEGQVSPISWPIPLSQADTAAIGEQIHVVGANGGGTCAGTSRNPTAPKGELCIYIADGHGTLATVFALIEMAPVAEAEYKVSSTGALIYLEGPQGPVTWAAGSFAITAP